MYMHINSTVSVSNIYHLGAVNECKMEAICGHQKCIDTVGSYRCTCQGLGMGQVKNLLLTIRGMCRYCQTTSRC